MNNEPVAIVELGGEITWLTDVLPYKAKLYTHLVKELTDEEIDELWDNYLSVRDEYGEELQILGVYEFARAILRKAQEK